jgi:predicted O-methyltransferase YrrM
MTESNKGMDNDLTMSPVISHFMEDGIAYTSINGTRGTLNYYDCMTIIEHAKNLEPGEKYIETGSYLGCSALLVALHSNVTVWAHDIWVTDWTKLKGCPPPMEKDYFYKFYSAVKSNGLVNRIIPIRGDSVYTLGIHDDKSIDLCFIDGDHSYEGCLGDLMAVFPKMNTCGTILIHDCTPNSETLKAVKDFTEDNGLDFTIIPGTWGMARIII